MPKTSDDPERGRGRPRDAGKDHAIRAAAWDVLARHGYGGLTFEAVAEAAGCTRATLYRRFTSKVDLVSAVFHETSREIEPAALADLPPRDALTAIVEGTMELMSGGRGPAILSLAAAAARLPELQAATTINKDIERRLHSSVYLRLAPGASEERMAFAFDTFIGIMLSHVILSEKRLDRSEVDLVVDIMIDLLMRP